jgi:hypothetical protein
MTSTIMTTTPCVPLRLVPSAPWPPGASGSTGQAECIFKAAPQPSTSSRYPETMKTGSVFVTGKSFLRRLGLPLSGITRDLEAAFGPPCGGSRLGIMRIPRRPRRLCAGCILEAAHSMVRSRNAPAAGFGLAPVKARLMWRNAFPGRR